MGNLLVIGLHDLRPLFGAYELFVGSLRNFFFQPVMIVDLYGTAPSLLLTMACFYILLR